MVTLEQFLVVALVVLLTVIVACGVVALVLLKRAIDDEMKTRNSASEHRLTSLESDRPTETDLLQAEARYEESLRQVARAQFKLRDANAALEAARRDSVEQMRDANAALEDAKAAAASIAYRVRLAEESYDKAIAQ